MCSCSVPCPRFPLPANGSSIVQDWPAARHRPPWGQEHGSHSQGAPASWKRQQQTHPSSTRTPRRAEVLRTPRTLPSALRPPVPLSLPLWSPQAPSEPSLSLLPLTCPVSCLRVGAAFHPLCAECPARGGHPAGALQHFLSRSSLSPYHVPGPMRGCGDREQTRLLVLQTSKAAQGGTGSYTQNKRE